VGIDVVDRHSARVLRGLPRPRSVARVLGDEEVEVVRRSADPALVFWTLWAAKEAAFKAVTLLRGAPPVFAHAAFRVDLEERRVDYGEIGLDLSLHVGRDRLVSVARPRSSDPAPLVWSAGALDAIHRGVGGEPVDRLRERFSDAERDAVRGLSSALVRLAVRTEAAAFLGVDEDRLEVVCPPGPAGRRPPYLRLDGRMTNRCGVSISHDHDWLAWVVAGSPQGIQGR
jgi:phosphopantetheinyl transferase (holo-ACP synthase)